MRSLAILGRSNSYVSCPTSMEVWAANSPRKWDIVNRIFTLDNREAMERKFPSLYVNAGKRGIPIYMQRIYNDLPTSVKYPFEEIVNFFGKDIYFTNTICYMIALAIIEKYSKIGLYGVDQKGEKEYEEQKSGVEYWVGVARGNGVKVILQNTSNVCKVHECKRFYGYEVDNIEEVINISSND